MSTRFDYMTDLRVVKVFLVVSLLRRQHPPDVVLPGGLSRRPPLHGGPVGPQLGVVPLVGRVHLPRVEVAVVVRLEVVAEQLLRGEVRVVLAVVRHQPVRSG